MKTILEFLVIIFVTVLVTTSLRQFEMNDMVRAFISIVAGLLAGRLFSRLYLNNQKDN